MIIKIQVNKEMLEYLNKHSADLHICSRVADETIGIGELLTWYNLYATKEDSNLPEGLFDNGNVALLQTIDGFETFLPICLLPEIEKQIQIIEQKLRIEEEKQLKRIYISGPISGHDLEERRMAFCEVEERLDLCGFEPVNPMKNGLPADATTHEHMRRDVELLMTCDYIYMMRRWTHSKGCKVEFDVATAIGLPVLFEETGKMIKFV